MKKLNLKNEKKAVQTVTPNNAMQISMEDFFGNTVIDLSKAEAGTYEGVIEKVTENKGAEYSAYQLRVKVEGATLNVNIFDNQVRIFLAIYNYVNGTTFTDIRSLTGSPFVVYRYAMNDNKFKNCFVPELPIGDYVADFVELVADTVQAVVTIVFNVDGTNYFKSYNYELDEETKTRIANEIYFLAYALGFEDKVSYKDINTEAGTKLNVKCFVPTGLKNPVINFSKIKTEKKVTTTKVTRRF